MATLVDEVWDSGQAFVDPKILYMPDVLTVAKMLEEDYTGREFSVLFKGKWTVDGFEISEDYYIPKQEISWSSVDYKEDLYKIRTEQGFNTVMHSHPKGVSKTFSLDDEETINFHFDCSLLFHEGKFTLGHFGFKITDKLKISVNIKEASINMIMPDLLVDSRAISIKPIKMYGAKDTKDTTTYNRGSGPCPYGLSTAYCGFYDIHCSSCDSMIGGP